MRVNGLFGWVAHNNARSGAFLFAFAALTQPTAMVVLFMPLVFVDPRHAPWYAWTGYATRYAPLVALASAIAFAVGLRRHVGTVRDEAGVRPVDAGSEARLFGLLEPLAIAAGLPMPRVGVVETSARNAFACGVSQGSALLVVTRGLVDDLDDDELSAVLAHELVHIRKGDTRLIAAANVFMRGMSLLERVNPIKPKRYRQVATLLAAPIMFPIYLGIALLAQLCLRLGYASRLLIRASREFVADAEAVRLTQNPAALVSALRRIEGGVLAELPADQDAMLIAGTGRGLMATHPPISERIEAIVAVTGAMALDAGVRRDTRSAAQRRQSALRGEVAREAWAPNAARRLARIAATSAAPRKGVVDAFVRVGEGGDLSVFGLRWDMAAATLATFVAAMILHHGDPLGFMAQVGRALDRPNAPTQALIDGALGCRSAALSRLFGGSGAGAAHEACSPSASMAAAAEALGFHVIGDGRVLNDAQLAMLSPREIEDAGPASSFLAAPFVQLGSHDDAAAPHRERPPTDLAPSYPLPLHEAWRRLMEGDLRRYLGSRQCGVLVHVRVAGETDRSITWSVTSEGEERVRFVATLEPLGETATRVSLAVDDRQPTFRLYDGSLKDAAGRPVEDRVGEPVVYRPALDPPHRPAFAEAISAMLEQRLFDVSNVYVQGAFKPGDGATGGMCGDQRGRLVREATRFSIHDPMDFR